MTRTTESEDRIGRVPAIPDALRELRKATPEKAWTLLEKWLDEARAAGFHDGLSEGLRRGREQVVRASVDDLASRGQP